MNEFAVNNQYNDLYEPKFGDRGYTGQHGHPSGKKRIPTRQQLFDRIKQNAGEEVLRKFIAITGKK